MKGRCFLIQNILFLKQFLCSRPASCSNTGKSIYSRSLSACCTSGSCSRLIVGIICSCSPVTSCRCCWYSTLCILIRTIRFSICIWSCRIFIVITLSAVSTTATNNCYECQKNQSIRNKSYSRHAPLCD